MDKLQKLRRKIESIDISIIKLLVKRFKFTQQIQVLKRRLNLPIHQKNREKLLLLKYSSYAKRYGLPVVLIKKLFLQVFQYSKKSGIIRRSKN
jgi:chorismate mutase